MNGDRNRYRKRENREREGGEGGGLQPINVPLLQAFRVYYSKPQGDATDDYLVDHTIIMYLLDPQGDFTAYFGQNTTVDDMAKRIAQHVVAYGAQQKAG